MTWFRLDDQGAFHAKVIAVGNEAYGAWCRAGQWSSDHLTDGHIPTATAHLIATRRVWKKLVTTIPAGHTIGLATESPTGYEIHDYLVYNPSADSVRAERSARSEIKQAAGRKGGLQKAANRSKQTPSRTPSSGLAGPLAEPYQNVAPVPIPIPVPERSKIPEPVVVANRPEKPRLTTFEEPYWRTAYVDSVREALRGPWSLPDKQARSIRTAVEGHCDTLADIDAWIRRRVPAFVQATRDRAAYYAGLGPDGFLKWLNEESAKAPPSRSPAPAAVPERDYPPPTPEEAAELERALRDLVAPPEAKSGVRETLGDDLSPAEVERLETKRRETVAALRAAEAAAAEGTR